MGQLILVHRSSLGRDLILKLRVGVRLDVVLIIVILIVPGGWLPYGCGGLLRGFLWLRRVWAPVL
jgi:hypothetical protein